MALGGPQHVMYIHRYMHACIGAGRVRTTAGMHGMQHGVPDLAGRPYSPCPVCAVLATTQTGGCARLNSQLLNNFQPTLGL